MGERPSVITIVRCQHAAIFQPAKHGNLATFFDMMGFRMKVWKNTQIVCFCPFHYIDVSIPTVQCAAKHDSPSCKVKAVSASPFKNIHSNPLCSCQCSFLNGALLIFTSIRPPVPHPCFLSSSARETEAAALSQLFDSLYTFLRRRHVPATYR